MSPNAKAWIVIVLCLGMLALMKWRLGEPEKPPIEGAGDVDGWHG